MYLDRLLSISLFLMILIDFNVIAWNVGGALEKRNQIHLKEVV